jgi:hypothetical protein
MLQNRIITWVWRKYGRVTTPNDQITVASIPFRLSWTCHPVCCSKTERVMNAVCCWCETSSVTIAWECVKTSTWTWEGGSGQESGETHVIRSLIILSNIIVNKAEAKVKLPLCLIMMIIIIISFMGLEVCSLELNILLSSFHLSCVRLYACGTGWHSFALYSHSGGACFGY